MQPWFLMWYDFAFYQIEALKAIGVSEVVLAINYQPEVSGEVAIVKFGIPLMNS